MIRGLLTFLTPICLILAIAAIVLLAVSTDTPMHLTHTPTAQSGAVYLRSAHGRLYVVTRTGPGLGRWPGLKGWEYKSGRDAGRMFLAPAVREPEWTGGGFASDTITIRPAPRTVHYVAIPWWSVVAGLLIIPAIALIVHLRRRSTAYRRCPVCDEDAAGEEGMTCATCQTVQKEGAVPCGASTKLPPEVETSPAIGDAAGFATGRIMIRQDTAHIRRTFSGFLFGSLFAGIGMALLSVGIWRVTGHGFFETIVSIGPLLGGLIFFIVGTLIVAFSRRVRIDRVAGTVRVSGGTRAEEHSLRSATALQVLSKGAGMQSRGRNRSAPYCCYELNIVAGSKRINLLAHGNGQCLRRDARSFADFMRLPLLDHTGERLKLRAFGTGFMLTEGHPRTSISPDAPSTILPNPLSK